jgi:homoserine kinase
MSEVRAGRGVRVRAPASSANLGPGFDVLAAALALHLELEVVQTGTFALNTDLPVARGRHNLVVRAFERLHPADGFAFRVSSTIPLSGGLGSSAAAVLAGLMAADRLFGLDADVQALATEMEGHPDNVAAAMFGGVVICDGRDTHRLDVPGGLEAILVVPAKSVPTARARSALPATLSYPEVTANLAAIATLTLGLARADLDLIAAGLRDRIHQPYRASLFPRSADLLERACELGALGATISGAGPTVLVWSRCEETGAVLDGLVELTAGWAQAMRVPFEPAGATVADLAPA